MLRFVLCKGKTTRPYWCTVYFLLYLICLSKRCHTSVLDLLWSKISAYCLYFSFSSFFFPPSFCLCDLVEHAPESLLSMKHNLRTGRSNAATCWNKHFSLDTCINPLLVQLTIKNAYVFAFCLAFLEHVVMNLEINLTQFNFTIYLHLLLKLQKVPLVINYGRTIFFCWWYCTEIVLKSVITPHRRCFLRHLEVDKPNKCPFSFTVCPFCPQKVPLFVFTSYPRHVLVLLSNLVLPTSLFC